MLIENPRKEYIKLINNAKKENRKKDKKYFEKHHILPKSMFKKWKYRKRNLVLLTPEEHYFAHYLLYLIYNNREMANAFWFMLNSTNFEYNEELYKEVRLKARNIGNGAKKVYCLELDKEFVSIKNASMETFGKNRTGDISSCCRGKINTCGEIDINGILTRLHWCYLEDKEKFLLNKEKMLFESVHFQELKNKKISESKKGEIPWNKGKPTSEKTKQKISESKKGKLTSEKTKQKISESLKRKKKTQHMKDSLSKARGTKVMQIETGIIFDSISKAAKEFGSFIKIKNACKHNTLYCGYHWKILEEKIMSDKQKKKLKEIKGLKVKCIELNLVFDSGKDAALYFGKYKSTGSYIIKIARENGKYLGYHWKLI